METNGYVKFGGKGANKVHKGLSENGEWLMKIVIQWILITGDIKTNFK